MIIPNLKLDVLNCKISIAIFANSILKQFKWLISRTQTSTLIKKSIEFAFLLEPASKVYKKEYILVCSWISYRYSTEINELHSLNIRLEYNETLKTLSFANSTSKDEVWNLKPNLPKGKLRDVILNRLAWTAASVSAKKQNRNFYYFNNNCVLQL